MQLTEKQINEFRALYKRHFGIDLTPAEAREKALALISLVKIITDYRTEKPDAEGVPKND